MFGVYPAGSKWTVRFLSTVTAGEIRDRLVTHAGLLGGTLNEPFGKDRGAVIASYQGFLVMVETDLSGTELVVVPDIVLQNLLWSQNAGYGNQWSNREIKCLTGQAGWEELTGSAHERQKQLCSLVERAIDGSLTRPAEPSDSAVVPSTDDPLASDCADSLCGEDWEPSPYDYLEPVTDGDTSCSH